MAYWILNVLKNSNISLTYSYSRETIFNFLALFVSFLFSPFLALWSVLSFPLLLEFKSFNVWVNTSLIQNKLQTFIHVPQNTKTFGPFIKSFAMVHDINNILFTLFLASVYFILVFLIIRDFWKDSASLSPPPQLVAFDTVRAPDSDLLLPHSLTNKFFPLYCVAIRQKSLSSDYNAQLPRLLFLLFYNSTLHSCNSGWMTFEAIYTFTLYAFHHSEK